MRNLEILSHSPSGPSKPVPLLFVHGAFCGAWIWAEKFLPWFAARGYEAHAVSLRGHGRSEGQDRIHDFGIADYVEDVLAAAGECSSPPVLIGHSMGGMVVQRALAADAELPAAVLMASAPPHGLMASTVGLAWRDPYVFRQMSKMMAFGTQAMGFEALYRAMFSDSMPREEAARYEDRVQEESRRVMLDIGGWIPFPPLPSHKPPVLVLGAEKDLLFPPDQVHATAWAFGTKATFFPDMGHSMMLQPGWEDVALHIARWLEKGPAR
ncbi:alpha/beta hydrolase [Skermanella stibiiresistens SB22]|uniref:Alpha/beta hydrolase n=1 Tax=Skermanella stibiiresistens SB22 TaxID=1385369 RepID=W9GVJ2_9PROT|nr:alpha/beta hydrolase [Skermanella stibiiresistens]EWY36636.1 alpha/beta hydrolase [Skermanella stibiiresistens SB22]